jgi:hypothetical protein
MYLWTIENHWLHCARTFHNHLSCPRLCGVAFWASESRWNICLCDVASGSARHYADVWPHRGFPALFSPLFNWATNVERMTTGDGFGVLRSRTQRAPNFLCGLATLFVEGWCSFVVHIQLSQYSGRAGQPRGRCPSLWKGKISLYVFQNVSVPHPASFLMGAVRPLPLA